MVLHEVAELVPTVVEVVWEVADVGNVVEIDEKVVLTEEAASQHDMVGNLGQTPPFEVVFLAMLTYHQDHVQVVASVEEAELHQAELAEQGLA